MILLHPSIGLMPQVLKTLEWLCANTELSDARIPLRNSQIASCVHIFFDVHK